VWPGVRVTGGPRSAGTGVANAMAVGRSRSTVNACNERASAKRSNNNNNNNNNNNRDAYHIRFPVCAPRTCITPLARRHCNADTLCVHCTRRVYCVQRFARVAQRRPSLSSSTWRLDAGDSRTRTHPTEFERVNDTAAAAMIATAAARAPPPLLTLRWSVVRCTLD